MPVRTLIIALLAAAASIGGADNLDSLGFDATGVSSQTEDDAPNDAARVDKAKGHQKSKMMARVDKDLHKGTEHRHSDEPHFMYAGRDAMMPFGMMDMPGMMDDDADRGGYGPMFAGGAFGAAGMGDMGDMDMDSMGDGDYYMGELPADMVEPDYLTTPYFRNMER